MNYLNQLIGKKITSLEDGIAKDMGLTIFFEEYIVNIFNPVNLVGGAKSFVDLVGLTLKEVKTTKELVCFIFENKTELTVDLRDDAYTGPEAMTLGGPNNLFVVWN